MGMIDLEMNLHGQERQDDYTGRVVGFSSRLNTILVPQAFMDYANARYASETHPEPSRLLVQVANPADEGFSKYIEKKGYEMEDDRLNAEKTTYFLRLVVTLVMVIGLIISLLSFYILMLSIYLLVQKNSSKLENLLLIGYSPARVGAPYQWLTIILNAAVLLIALIALFFVRRYYMDMVYALFPQIEEGTMLPALLVGLGLFLLVTLMNQLAIRRKVMAIWKRKE